MFEILYLFLRCKSEIIVYGGLKTTMSVNNQMKTYQTTKL